MERVRDFGRRLWDVLRPYVSVAVIAVFAVLFFRLGAGGHSDLAKSAINAGFVAAGAAVVRFVDVFDRLQRERADAARRHREALDETRRVTSMALVRYKTQHPELVATIANAFANHDLGQQRVPFDDVVEHVVRVVDGRDVDQSSRKWLEDRVALLSGESAPAVTEAPAIPHQTRD